MSRPGKIPVYFVVLFAALMGVLACDSGPMDDGGNDEVTITAALSADDGGTLSGCEVVFQPENGSAVTKNSCNDPSAGFKKNSGSVTVTATADNYQQMEKTTSTKSSSTVKFPLKPESPDQSQVTITAALSAADGGTLSGCKVDFKPESGSTVSKNSCDDPSADFKKNSGSVDVTATADQRQKMEKTASTDSSSRLEFALKPDQSQVTFDATEADTSVAVEVYVADTLAAEGVKPTASFPYGETIEARIEGEYIQTKKITFTADKASKTVPVELERKQISITVRAADDSSTVGIANPHTGDSTEAEANISETLPARSGNYVGYGRRRHWETISEKLSASEDHDLTLDVPYIYVCENKIDDDEDGNADANDPGCLNEDGNYQPQDTSENHVFVRVVSGSGGEGNDVNSFVSSKEGQRREATPGDIGSNGTINLPASIVDAVVAGAKVEMKRDSTQDGEAFDGKFKCGPSNDNLNNVNTSGIVADENKQHGWGIKGFPGVGIEFFETGPKCRIIYRHWTYVEGKPPGDGNDDVFFLKAGDDEIRVLVFAYFVEAEDYPADKNMRNAHNRSGRSSAHTPQTEVRMNCYPR